MASEAFQTQSFQDLIDAGVLEIGDGYRAKNEELGGNGPIFLRAGHMSDTHIDFDGVERFHAELAPRVCGKMARPGDTIITTKGNSTGRTSFVTRRMPPFVYSPHLSYWRSLDPKKLVNGFLRYWSRGSQFIRQLSGMKASTDMAPYLSLTDQRRLKITLPPLRHQEAIAHILGTLDDKIELNRRMNETLEAMARALFKSWFVDFDPVRAKMDGRQPEGMDKATADLFPDSFEDSPLGKIPKGWRVCSIGEVVRAVGGGTPSTKEPAYWENGVHHWATPKDLSAMSFPILLDTERKITNAGLRKISSGLLPPGTLLLSSRAPIVYLAIAQMPVAVNQGFIAIVCDQEISAFFMLNWLLENMDEIDRRSSGTTFMEISKQNFRPIPILVPSHGPLSAFDTEVVPLYHEIVANLRQSISLGALRDSLLPKLLSGEIQVRAVEEMVERAT